MSNSALSGLVAGIVSGKIRVIDLTQTLSRQFPQITLPPEFGQCWPFRIEEISRYDERGPSWYWNNFSCGEHTGTHFDAPIHWVSGRDLPGNATDTIPVQHLIGGACVIDCSREAAENPNYLLTRDRVLAWERQHGKIPPRSWFLMRTDWSKRWNTDAYLNRDAAGRHTPGPRVSLVRFLIAERDVIGFGTECLSTDAGLARKFEPAYPCHTLMHGSGRYGLQCLTNLDLLPPTGSIICAAPLKIRGGSGSPLRVLAMVAKKGANLIAD
jgi:kynurenine formamidase